METVINVNKPYNKPKDLKNLINYATNEEKTLGVIGAVGTNPFDADMMYNAMLSVKKSFGKDGYGRKQLFHIIVSPNPNRTITPTPMQCLSIAYDICKYFSERYQICFGVHQDTDILHIHFVLNSVSFIDGRMFPGFSPFNLVTFKQYVEEIIYKYFPELRKPLTIYDFEKDDTTAVEIYKEAIEFY